MLVLSRKLGEQVMLGDNIWVTVLAIHGNRVRLGFTAPAEVSIQREELLLRDDCLDTSDGPPLTSEFQR